MTQAELVRSNSSTDRARTLVGVLRERVPGGLREVLAPVLADRDRVLAGQISPAGAALLNGYDRLLLAALGTRYDALDRAVRDTTFAIAEIDGDGAISYANKALAAMLPDAVGHDFAALFGPRAQDVRDALSSGTRKTLRLDLYSGSQASVHLQGEIGPLSDEHDRSGAYALLLGLDGEEARLNALPDGIVRLDADGKVTFASPHAEEIFGLSNEEMRGRPAASLFTRAGSPGSPLPTAEWLGFTEGRKETAEVPDPHGNGTTPVRITVTPYFDSAQSRAGLLLTVLPIARELARADLQKALSDPDCEPECLIRRVMRAVKRIIPYDLATFGVYTDDMMHHNTLAVEPQPEWPWTTAWFPCKGAKEFLLSQHTWGDDLQEDAKTLAPELDDDDVMKHVIDDGMKGYVTLPIGGGGQSIRASLTLLSKQANCYDGDEIEDLRELGVEKALLVAEANLSRRRVDRARRLEEKLTGAAGYRELAETLAHGISECFGWDYVAVFALDRRAELFRMIAQHNGTGNPALQDDYSQPFTEGLLGAALRANGPKIESNIQVEGQQTYKAVIPGRRSAAALPIRVVRRKAKPAADEIEWMLAIESGQRNAFQGPSMRSLDEALAQCEYILRQRWYNFMQTSLLDAVEQALVFVDRAGKIRLTNPRANTLFGGRGDLLFGEPLATLGAEDGDKRLLESAGIISQARLTLCLDQGVNAPTLATQRPVGDDYGHRLWLFTDLREQEYQNDRGYLEQTVNEVAHNVRLPLMVAGNLVLSAAEKLRGKRAQILKNAVRQLGKADITYERLVSTLSARRKPDWPPQMFDAVDVLRQAVFDLPDEDLACCDPGNLQSASEPFVVAGWPDQLKFAFRSVLAHLLLQRPCDEKVRIAVDETKDGPLKVALSVPTGGAAVDNATCTIATDRIRSAEQRAREAASLAAEAVELAVRRHDGEFMPDHHDGMLTFKFELRHRQPSA